MKNYSSPELTVLGTVAAETLASVITPLLKCPGGADALSNLTVRDGSSVCPKP